MIVPENDWSWTGGALSHIDLEKITRNRWDVYCQGLKQGLSGHYYKTKVQPPSDDWFDYLCQFCNEEEDK